MSTKILIAGLCEQDLDLFFLEEVVSNPSFRTWLLSLVHAWPSGFHELSSAKRSVAYANGESDLELTFANGRGACAKLLVENKVAAGFQPNQLDRYRARAAGYVQAGECAHASVALIAPGAYMPAASSKVDATISYEAVEAWLAAQDPDERTSYKLQLVRFAIEKHAQGYNPEVDRAVTDFWHAYWQEARIAAPELEMDDPGPKPAGATFVWFFPSRLPSEPDLNICHKFAKGYVDLHFPGWGQRIGDLNSRLGDLLKTEVKFVKTGKSAALRIAGTPSTRAGEHEHAH